MTIQHNLRSEGRIASHLESDVPPVGIHHVEGIVIDEGSLGFDVLDDALFGPPHFPRRRRSPGNANHEESTWGRIRAARHISTLLSSRNQNTKNKSAAMAAAAI